MISFTKHILNEISLHDHYQNYMVNKYDGLSVEVYQKIATIDPSTTRENRGKYVEWLLKILNNKARLFNDSLDKYIRATASSIPVSRLKSSLEKLDKHPGKKDINSFKTLSQLFDYVDSLPLTGKEMKQHEKDIFGNKDILIIDNNEKWIVARPLTHDANKRLAYYKCPIGADWCTARRDNDFAFHDYDQRGILLAFINKHNPEEKYQLFLNLNTFEVEEIKDASDEIEIDPEEFYHEIIGTEYMVATTRYLQQFEDKYK